MISFDPHYLSETLNNLISNAVKFSYRNSEVLIKVGMNGKNMIRTEVIDHGKGISVSEQNRLFKYFTTTSTRPTVGEKSTGLELAIAKKIILEHRGNIGVVSEIDKGANFYYDLPLSPE